MSMTPEQFRRADAVFEAARRLPSDEQIAFVERACSDDVQLCEEVRALLAHDADPAITLESPIMSGALRECLADPLHAARLPERLGAYRIIRHLGEGGFGVVYLAEQENPRRTVALKMLRPGMASRHLLRRFEMEAQTLGRLQHPGIAHIFEAGSAELNGHRQAFLAMEYVRGRKLDVYCDAAGDPPRRLDIRQRLDIMARVCDALQHAHQHGVIHRDLKPDNIIVDDTGQPRILDFGVARVIDAEAPLTTLSTNVGQIIGTLPYMSPEQVRGNPADIDTRSDVYAVGVLMFQLLTGRLPHDLQSRSLPEASNAICDEPIPSLSSVNRALRGDIETIVGKSLAKDRDRRYQSVADLASDIRRFLAGEPIEARRDSAMYVLRKQLRRYSVALGVAAAFAVLVTVSTIALSVLYSRQSDLLKDVSRERDRAESSAETASATTRFLQQMLSSTRPMSQAGATRTLVDILDDATGRLDRGELQGQPEIEAAIRTTLGSSYRELGLFPKAEDHLRRAVALRKQEYGVENMLTAQSMSELALSLVDPDDAAEARAILERVLSIEKSLRGDVHVDVARNLSNLGSMLADSGELEQAETLYRQALDVHRRLLGDEHEDVATNLNNLATLLKDRGDLQQSEQMHREALRIRRKLWPAGHPDIAQSLSNLAIVVQLQGDPASAEPLLREANSLRLRLLGENHPDLATSRSNLAACLFALGKFDEAETLARLALAAIEKRLEPHHPNVTRATLNLAGIQHRRGIDDESRRLLARAIAGKRRETGGQDAETAGLLALLGEWLIEAGFFEDAEPPLREAIGIREALGVDSGDLHVARSHLGAALSGQKRFAEAEALLLESHKALKENQNMPPRLRSISAARLAKLYANWGRPDDADRWAGVAATQPASPESATASGA